MNYGDIFWAAVPDEGGHRQMGHRPVVIFQDVAAYQCPTVLVIPLTSQLARLRIPGTLLINPSATNGLTLPSVALVFQVSPVDTDDIEECIGRLDDPDLQAIQALARKLMIL